MSGKLRILVAMPREAELLGLPCEIIGIGATSLPEISEDDVVVNVGYCGANGIQVGTVVEPFISVDTGTWQTEILEPHFDCKKTVCLTSRSFVTKPIFEASAVYDMELSKIASIKCRKLYCLKIVSDNLNETDCENFNDAGAWAQVRQMLTEVINNTGPTGGIAL